MIIRYVDSRYKLLENYDNILDTDIYVWFDCWDIKFLTNHFNDYGYPKIVLSDCAKIYSDFPIPVYGCYSIASRFLQSYQSINYADEYSTKYCANIFVNKKQMSRYLTLKLAEINDISFEYIWNGIGRSADFSSVFAEIELSSIVTDSKKKELLGPISLRKQWINDSYGTQDPDTVDNVFELPHGGDNVYCWHTFMKQLISESAVSLINENVNFEKANALTWKTVMPILGLTFPIWPGGYRCAEETKNLGFDIFDDIIDHSYQYRDTLFERCWYAFCDNLKILTDIKYASSIRLKYKNRLLKNRQHFLDGAMYRGCLTDIQSCNIPQEAQEILIQLLLKKWNKGSTWQ